MDGGKIILPVGEEFDEGAVDVEALTVSLLAQIDKGGEVLRAAALAAFTAERTEAERMPDKLGPLPFPIDKLTKAITSNPAGSGTIDTASKEQKARGVHLLTWMSLEFVGQAAEREINLLSPFDRRVLLTLGGLYANGVHTVTLAQVFAKMGGGPKPNREQLEKISQSIETLCCTRVQADNSAERAVDPDRPKISKMRFSLLEARQVSIEYRGKTVEAVTVLAAPQWLQLAELRGQLDRVPFEAFADGLSMTAQSIALSDYLLDRIAHMNRNPKGAEKRIRIDTAAEKTGTSLQSRAMRRKFSEKVEKKLRHFVKIGHITGYKTYEGGFSVLPKKRKKG